MDIKILGSGCEKCSKTYKLAKEVVGEMGINANVEKVEDLKEILKYGVMKTPGLVIDDEVKSSGKTFSKKELKNIIEKNK
ncbi:thioredoxin family protein [Dethiothermospora halolimnae]|uniref:thioredoxin family protein n=1 Tax=Dethiothermospora halolimnae TaxID=3114390 RepID=UPI003CCC0204